MTEPLGWGSFVLGGFFVRAVLQRCSRAAVRVAGATVGQIGPGLMVLLGVGVGDTREQATYLAEKIVALRIFNDAEGKMNLSLRDVGGSVLAVSQFTLYADTSRGRRPSYVKAAPPAEANELYEFFVSELRRLGVTVETGVFGAHMEVDFVNDGPVTILLEAEAACE